MRLLDAAEALNLYNCGTFTMALNPKRPQIQPRQPTPPRHEHPPLPGLTLLARGTAAIISGGHLGKRVKAHLPIDVPAIPGNVRAIRLNPMWDDMRIVVFDRTGVTVETDSDWSGEWLIFGTLEIGGTGEYRP